LENEQQVSPLFQTAGQEKKGETVSSGQAWSIDLALEDQELLAQQGVLEQELRPGACQVEGEGE
jgi:hypothetical protein